MSDIHILDLMPDGKNVSVVFHVAIPATNNQVGTSYQTVLVAYLGGADAIVSTVATGAELTAMKTGSLYEIRTSVNFSILGLSSAQQLVEIKAAYNARKTAILADLQARLAYYGYSTSAT